MRLVHYPADGEPRTLADDVDVAESVFRKGIGLMGRSSIPDGYALVFRFDDTARRHIHMIGVRTPLDVVWLDDGEVINVETLPAWWGFAAARADTVIELAPGAAAELQTGDSVRIRTN